MLLLKGRISSLFLLPQYLTRAMFAFAIAVAFIDFTIMISLKFMGPARGETAFFPLPSSFCSFFGVDLDLSAQLDVPLVRHFFVKGIDSGSGRIRTAGL